VLDLGTGSGCLLLAVLSELPNAQGLASISAGLPSTLRLPMPSRWVWPPAPIPPGRLGQRPRRALRSDYLQPALYTGRGDTGLAPEVAKFDPTLAWPVGLTGWMLIAVCKVNCRGFWPRVAGPS